MSVAEKVTAAVRTAPQTTEFWEYDMPDIPDEADDLWSRIARNLHPSEVVGIYIDGNVFLLPLTEPG